MFGNDFKTLNAFIHTARHGSFTAAAQHLGISTAAVSKSVGVLEKSLGARLFNRTTRSLSLTAEGERFFAQAEAAVAALEQAAAEVRRDDGGQAGLIRISVSNTIGRNLILPCLKSLLDAHPLLDIELDFDDRVIDFVKEGFDLVVRGGRIAESAMISRNIAPLYLCLAASPDYLAQHGTPQSAEDLAAHRLIGRRFLSGKLQDWHFWQGDTLIPFAPGGRSLVFTDPEACTLAALAGCGITEIPMYLAWPHLQAGRLKMLLSGSHYAGDYRLVLQYAHRNLPPRVRTVAEHLLATLKAHPALNLHPQQAA